MALNTNALMLPGQGYILLNEPGSQYEPTVAELEAFAANTSTLPKGSQILGHTSREDLVAMSKDGGDSEVLGSWEQEQIETIVSSAATEYIDVTAHQFDNSVFSLYYGGGDDTQAGRFAVPKNAVPPKKSLTIVYLTRGQVVGQFFANTSVRGEDAMEHSVDAYSTIPLRFTVLDPTDGGARQVWIGRNFGAATVDPGTGSQAPVVNGLAPDTGALAGGESVVITGTGFTAASAVKFGTVNATSFTVDSATQITAVAPADFDGVPGAVDVTVTTPNGTSASSANASYTYEAAAGGTAPDITGLAPSGGALAGGESITITGTGFTGATSVTFGAVSSTFTVDSDTTITATAPADADQVAGPVDVVVTTPAGASQAQVYTYA